MKKLLLLSTFLIFACSTDSEGNPCIYEPTLETNEVTEITETSATLNGIISIVSENCDVPNNTEQGFVYSTEIQPTLEDTQVNVNGTNISTTIEGLTPNTTYYVRAFLTNNLGDFYGDEVGFTTIDGIINCDGNPVPTIVYGIQEWTIENACHTTYRDGTPIPQVTDNDEWYNLTTGAWCYYDNDPNKGVLYNWYAVAGIHDNDENTPNKEFAPDGWHVPNQEDWTSLKEYLIANGYNYDGTTENNLIAKAVASQIGWEPSNVTPGIGTVGNNPETNNSSGFNAHPIGLRRISTFLGEAFFTNTSRTTCFWSSTEAETFNEANHHHISYNSSVFIGNTDFLEKQNGYSVRLVKD